MIVHEACQLVKPSLGWSCITIMMYAVTPTNIIVDNNMVEWCMTWLGFIDRKNDEIHGIASNRIGEHRKIMDPFRIFTLLSTVHNTLLTGYPPTRPWWIPVQRFL